MNKEELRKKRNRTIESIDDIKAVLSLDELYIDELEEKISVLLSCKNCPENKGGLICAKEYEDKCLAQKIEFIKELREENAELKRDKKDLIFIRNQNAKCMCEDKEHLTKAKELLNEFMRISKASDEDFEHDYSELIGEAEQFLSEVEK